MEEEAEKVREHEGNIFTVIVSLKHPDAERLGYNYAERWRTLVQNRIDDIAKEYKIPPGSLKWFGAFHNESHHPHIHLLLYSTDKFEKGFINKKGIDNLRRLFGTEIFRDDLNNVYDEQTEYRNLLNADARDAVSVLADKIKNGLADNNEFVIKFVELAKRMQSVKGKRVYGYLPKSVKAMVKKVVDLLEKDTDIQHIYELWYQAKCAVYATYTDNPPPKKPLSGEEAFKPIRNAVIKEADELGKLLLIFDNDEETLNHDTTEKNFTENDNNSTLPAPNTNSGTQNTNTSNPKNATDQASVKNGYMLASITRFASSLSRIFRERFDEQASNAPTNVDSRLWREIEAKKKGQNISM